MPDLTVSPEEASRICMKECRAMCCRGPIILRLDPDEITGFYRLAADLGAEARISRAEDGGGNVLFLDQPGERCPMLDTATSGCRIYQHRPRVCREFPRKREPGCPLSERITPEPEPDQTP